MLVPAPSANCKTDDGDFILEIDDFKGANNDRLTCIIPDTHSKTVPLQMFSASQAFVRLDVEQDHVFNNTLMYITGFVCKKMLDVHHCSRCRSAMLRHDVKNVGSNDLFCVHKAYSTNRSSFGGLKAPGDFMYNLVSAFECKFQSNFDRVKHTVGVCHQLLDSVSSHFEFDESKPCMESQKQAAKLYISTRIHYKLKFLNHEIVKVHSSKRNRKAVKVISYT